MGNNCNISDIFHRVWILILEYEKTSSRQLVAQIVNIVQHF
jgi:hypothetical protein